MEEWIDKSLFIKKDRVIVKLHKDNAFWKSVIIPTDYYPLDNNRIEVFHAGNCQKVTDNTVISAFDSLKYEIGHCYGNSEKIVKKLNSVGIKAVQYVGWLFVGERIPVFHSWAVIDNSVLDLADDFSVLYGANSEVWQGVNSREEFAELLADFYNNVQENKITNSQRCANVGVPTQGLLYVGCECNANKGKELYNTIRAKYPDHEACYTASGTYTPFQQQFISKINK